MTNRDTLTVFLNKWVLSMPTNAVAELEGIRDSLFPKSEQDVYLENGQPKPQPEPVKEKALAGG